MPHIVTLCLALFPAYQTQTIHVWNKFSYIYHNKKSTKRREKKSTHGSLWETVSPCHLLVPFGRPFFLFFLHMAATAQQPLFFKAAKAPGSQQMASSMRNIERALWVSRGDIKVGPKKPMVIIEIEITTYK